MTTELAPPVPGLAPWPCNVERLIHRCQERRSSSTVHAYGRDLAPLTRWSEASAPGEAITRLLTGGRGQPALACLPWRHACGTPARSIEMTTPGGGWA
jgi:hypothetical protein